MRMHVQRVDREVIRCEIERLEHLFQCKILAVSVNDDFLELVELMSRSHLAHGEACS